MTDVNKDDIMKNNEEERLKRRRILKAGAAIAPLAVTLHGGNAMAAVISASCVDKMTGKLQIPKYEKSIENGSVVYTQVTTTGFDKNAKTGRLTAGGADETHWNYISIPGNAGHSCYTSITIASN